MKRIAENGADNSADNSAPGFKQFPHHHLSVLPSRQHIRGIFNDTVVVDSDKCLLIEEDGYPAVAYIHKDDVRIDRMQKTKDSTYCPFKGKATYWTLVVDGRCAINFAWSYESPYNEVMEIKNYIAFYPEKMDAWLEDSSVARIEETVVQS